MNFLSRNKIIILLCFLSAIILRLFHLFTPILDSDYAIVGLSARHILRGEFPLFFYGDSFEGIIEGYLAAPLFWLFGPSRIVLDYVPVIMSLVIIYTVYKLARIIYGNATAKLALLFASIAPPFFILMTTVPLEGYIETTILGALAFIITYKIIYRPKNVLKLHFLLGLTIGFALYLQFHIVPFAITVGIFLFLNDKKLFFKKTFIALMTGFVIGNLPLLIYNITHKFSTLQIITKQHATFLGTLKHLFGYGYWVILGARAEFAQENYIPYVSSLILLIYLGCFIYLFVRKKPGSEFLITFLLIFPITYWLSGRGETNTRRYLLPLYSVVFIVLAYGINALREKNKLLSYTIIALILGSNLYTNFISIPIFNTNAKADYEMRLLQDKQLYDFLKTNNIRGAYTLSWWNSLKFDFDFKEDIILTLIDGEPYPKYQKAVDSQFDPAFIDHFSEFKPTLDSIGGLYKTQTLISPSGSISPYTIYYNFVPTEQTLEEIDNSKWTACSSHNDKIVNLAFDRDILTRWHSDTAQKEGMAFTIDLGAEYTNLTRLCYHPGPATDWPCSYELYTSSDGNSWQCAAKNCAFIMPIFWDGPHPFVKNINGLIEMDFTPHTARYLKIVLTKNKERFYWSIAELYIYRQKDKNKKDWNIDNLTKRIAQIKPRKLYADPWIMSHLDEKSYFIGENETVDNNYVYNYFLVETNKLKDCVFVVQEENYSSFIKAVGNVEYNVEDFGPYKLIIFDKNSNNPVKLYWDWFHLLKCTY